MIKSKRQMKILIGSISALMLVVILGIVYSAFSGSLTINGTGVLRNSSWNIHIVETGELDPTSNVSDSVKVLQKPSVSGTTIGDYRVSLTTPGDSISYTFNVINEGDYNAKISSVNISTPECAGTDETSKSNVCSKLSYTLKYASGASVSTNDMIASQETKTMILTLTYQDFSDASLLPTSDVTISNLGITINYVQVDSAVVNNDDGSTPKVYNTYNVGDVVPLGNEEYYVLSDNNVYVTLLKAEPLTVDEVNEYGAGHINRYTYDSVGAASNQNGYGGMAYYSSETCGYVNSSWVETGCTTDYNRSDVKYAVDDWANSKFNVGELAIDSEGYKARLIAIEELENLGYSYNGSEQGYSALGHYPVNSSVPNWLYSNQYNYWTMSPYTILPYKHVWFVYLGGTVDDYLVSERLVVRPVINVYKSVLE